MSSIIVNYDNDNFISKNINGVYHETSLYINNSKVYNKIHTSMFIYKIPYNDLPLKEKYRGCNPFKLYEGRWVIGKIKGFDASVSSIWAYSNKRIKGDSFEDSDLEWYECTNNNLITVNKK